MDTHKLDLSLLHTSVVTRLSQLKSPEFRSLPLKLQSSRAKRHSPSNSSNSSYQLEGGDSDKGGNGYGEEEYFEDEIDPEDPYQIN